MEVESITGMLGGVAPYGLIAFLGLILAVLVGLLLVVGTRTNPGLAVVGVGLTAIGGAVSAWMSVPWDAAAEGAFEAVRQAALIRFVAWIGISAVGLAGLSVLAVAGARKPPRDFVAAGIGAVGVLLVVVLTAVSGAMNGDWGAGIFFHIRAFEYAVLGALVPVALLGGGEPGSTGRDAGAAAAMSFGLIVAVSEAAGRGVTAFFLLTMIGTQPVDKRAEITRTWFENTGGEVPWMLATVALGLCVAVVGVALSSRAGNRRALATLLWLPVAVGVWFAGQVSPELCTAVALTLP